MALHLVLVFISLLPLSLASANCNSTCGKFTISPPFGINDSDCYHNKGFEIECKQDPAGFHRPYLKRIKLEVTKFDHSSCKVWVNNPIYAWNCKNNNASSLPINMSTSPFAYSREDNVFLGVGCNTQALLVKGDDAFGGCVSICNNNNSHNNHSGIGACVGHYCCAASLPRRLSEFNPRIEHLAANSNRNHDDDEDSCSYALIAQDNGHNDWGGRIVSELKDLNSSAAVLEYYSDDSDITCSRALAVCSTPCGSTGPYYIYESIF